MGNQVLSQGERKEGAGEKLGGIKIEGREEINREEIYMHEIYSINKGIKANTDTDARSSNMDKSISNDTTSVVTANEKPEFEVKVPTLFEWKDGGNLVYVTGSFSNWTQWFVMTKNPKSGFFELVLDLPRGIHFFKFIVDGKWCFSKHHQTSTDDKDNMNNILDTNVIPISVAKNGKGFPQPLNKIEELKKNLTEDYTQFYPPKGDMNLDSPNIPVHYNSPFVIDHISHQHLFGNTQYIDNTFRRDFTANNSSKNILITPHVNL